MIGVLIIGHDTLPESLAQAATHVLGARPAQFDVLPVTCNDDPLDVLPRAQAALAKIDTGEGVLILSDIYGATPCNLVGKLIDPGRVEAVAGVNLPMLVRALTYRNKDLETMVKKAVSGGCEGVLHLEVDPRHAATRG
ncbi:MAG TPA: PTS fructose transporter subunit IIA [Casimicrobiaceae bacterium]|nr:PTS fructose transporter subunit IIA [Casimicrobiaceae bacterium]